MIAYVKEYIEITACMYMKGEMKDEKMDDYIVFVHSSHSTCSLSGGVRV